MSLLELVVSRLSAVVLNPSYRLLKGDRSTAFVQDVERLNRQGIEDIRAHQLNRLRHVCALAASRTPFYAQKWKRALGDFSSMSWDEFQELPVLTKDDLRLHEKDLVNREVSIPELRASATGGTTASPVTIHMDWESFWHRRGATLAFDRWLGYTPGQRAAYLWGARQDFTDTQTLKARVVQELVHRNRFYPTSLLDDAVMWEYYRDLKKFKPRLLQAYATPLDIFSRFLLRNRLTLEIPAISTTAESLGAEQRARIRQAFGVEPFDWYGSRECGRVATECEAHEGMHINAYGLHVETARMEGMENDLGPIVITDLWNEGAPIIRYDTGDIGKVTEERCRCGRELPRLISIVGRTTDVFVNSRGQKVPGVAFTNRIITESAQIEEMQIVQRGYRDFEVLVKPGPDYSSDTGSWIGNRISLFMAEETSVEIRLVDGIPREASGKLLFCKNMMGNVEGPGDSA